MTRIFITGATGNVGLELIKAISNLPTAMEVVAASRNLASDAAKLAVYPNIKTHFFDFENTATFAPALLHQQVLFLLRPPQLAQVKKYFKPLIAAAVSAGIKHIVFLSVQGVQNNKLIPHYGIEKLIQASGVPYTFLRPAYFMQNFTSTLHPELVQHNRIFLPAGKARFTLVDVRDVAAVAAQVVNQLDAHRNKAYELTTAEKLSFGTMAAKLSAALGRQITYESPSLLKFYRSKRREGMDAMLIWVMIMLHYLPRFQAEPPTTAWVQQITGKAPIAFDEFAQQYRAALS